MLGSPYARREGPMLSAKLKLSVSAQGGINAAQTALLELALHDGVITNPHRGTVRRLAYVQS
jgi:hypothetical protein